jgi:trk system potassium uptake protein TrkH
MLLIRQFKSVWKDEELRFYLGAVFVSVLMIAWNIRGIYGTIGETLRHAAFQVASIVTTTGFATTDFDLWPALSKMILLTLMLIGASAGSTGGGFKFARLLLILKSIRRNIRQVLQPQKIQVVRVNGQPVDEKILENTNAYLAIYMIIIVVSCIFVAVDGFSMTTNISAVIACFNNVGPGFEAVGATCNFAGFGYFSKLVLIIDMLAGRLEIFPILILFSGAAWRHR